MTAWKEVQRQWKKKVKKMFIKIWTVIFIFLFNDWLFLTRTVQAKVPQIAIE